MEDYGYKVCFKKQGKNKMKLYPVTNTYDLAQWSVHWHESHSPPDRKTKRPIIDAVWKIIPIKTYLGQTAPARTFL